ncbi:MAG: hypothetical protein ACFE8F_03805 [Promethearchaeota archaeon]
MAYSGSVAAASSAEYTATASALCLPAPYVKVLPEDFVILVENLFTIVHIWKGSRHLYFGRFLDRFVVYTQTREPLKIPVDLEGDKITKTIRL